MSEELERAVARLLGATRQEAEAAVGAVAARGLLPHGMLFLAVLASARWGCDAAEALRRFARGDEPPADWSDYEARTAREEVAEEAAAALARLDTLADESGDDALASRLRLLLTAAAQG